MEMCKYISKSMSDQCHICVNVHFKTNTRTDTEMQYIVNIDFLENFGTLFLKVFPPPLQPAFMKHTSVIPSTE